MILGRRGIAGPGFRWNWDTRKPIPRIWFWIFDKLCILMLSVCLIFLIVLIVNPFQPSENTRDSPKNFDRDTAIGIDGHNEMINSEDCQFGRLTTKAVFSGRLGLPQDDTQLLGYVKACRMIPPSTMPYNLDHLVGSVHDPKIYDIGKYVAKLLGNKEKGVFIDCGAKDGETKSQTLGLEREFGWSGLLIEADPLRSKKLLEKHRKAWIANVCVGIYSYPHEIRMFRNDDWTLTNFEAPKGASWTEFTVKCLPLYTMMRALNLIDVDYMSVDLRGAEMLVLQTLPFDEIRIKVFSIETSPSTWFNVRAFMKSKGYDFVKTFKRVGIEDDVFVHESLLGQYQP